jgi:GntR family transcriptional regulator/MocR family aminotransferase
VRDLIFPVGHDSPVGLQAQVRRHLVDAIMDGRLVPDQPLPSSRGLAKALGVSRNTVVLAYQALADEGVLISRERVGFFVNPDFLDEKQTASYERPAEEADPGGVEWRKRLRLRPSDLPHLRKPANWHKYPYPFIYGQGD